MVTWGDICIRLLKFPRSWVFYEENRNLTHCHGFWEWIVHYPDQFYIPIGTKMWEPPPPPPPQHWPAFILFVTCQKLNTSLLWRSFLQQLCKIQRILQFMFIIFISIHVIMILDITWAVIWFCTWWVTFLQHYSPIFDRVWQIFYVNFNGTVSSFVVVTFFSLLWK